jgi:Flp pilus assembly protein TadG
MAARSGSATVEFALAYAGLMLPATFALLFTSQLLWVWHSVNEYTRQSASYASTHCWENTADNVLTFMRANVPAMIDQTQFQNGPVQLSVTYFARDPDSGQLTAFSCDGNCSTGCIPDTVTVSVTGYQFRTFVTSLGLPPVIIPDFRTSLPVEGAGCDPEQGICLP